MVHSDSASGGYDSLKNQIPGAEFDAREFVLDPGKLVAVARAVGETRPAYLEPDHPDFQATPAFIGSLELSYKMGYY